MKDPGDHGHLHAVHPGADAAASVCFPVHEEEVASVRTAGMALGKSRKGETTEDGAKRELQEESGLTADALHRWTTSRLSLWVPLS